jgi:hypothetical protein
MTLRKPVRCPICSHVLERSGPCPYCGSKPLAEDVVREIPLSQQPDRLALFMRGAWKWVAAGYLFLVLLALVSQGGADPAPPLRLKSVLDSGCILVSLYGLTEALLWIRTATRG